MFPRLLDSGPVYGIRGRLVSKQRRVRGISLILNRASRPQGHDRFGRSDPPFAALDLRDCPRPRPWVPLLIPRGPLGASLRAREN